MTVVATRDLLRKESQGPERAHRPRRNIPLKTPDYKLHLFYTIVERSPLSGWREREQATPTSIISSSRKMADVRQDSTLIIPPPQMPGLSTLVITHYAYGV